MAERIHAISSRYDVVIAGAGIAGLALTRELLRRDVSCIALERRSSLVDAGLAINLPGNAIAALTALGLGNDLPTYGVPVERREYRSESDRLLFKVDEISFWGAENTPRCMLRSDLAKLLRQDIPESTVQTECAIAAASFRKDDVEVTTSEGDVVSASYLVGADGVNSTVRSWCLPDADSTPSHLGNASWRFVVSNPGIDCWTVWMGKNAIFLLIPCGPSKVYGWATIKGGSGDVRNMTSLLKHTKRFPLRVKQTVEEALSNGNGIYRSPLNEIKPSQWGRGRAILIGDAAHATAPVWAQGAALALEDASTLAELMSSGINDDNLVESLIRLRHSRVRHVQAMTDHASKVAGLPFHLRNLLFPVFGPVSYRKTYGPLRQAT